MQIDATNSRIFSEVREAYEVIGGRADLGFVLVCDHASNALPPEYGTLGLAPAELERHIAYDIGAAGVTRHLAARLGVPAILTNHSRLLIDVNRGEDDPTLVMRLSAGAIITGNHPLGAEELQRRIERFYRPYDAAITRVVDACIAAAPGVGILGVHSFTESWKGVARPWAASVLWERDPRIAEPMLTALRSRGDVVIGENEPYPGQYEGDTLWRHGTNRGIAHAIIEIRQDLIGTDEAQRRWAGIVAEVLMPLLPVRHRPRAPGAAAR